MLTTVPGQGALRAMDWAVLGLYVVTLIAAAIVVNRRRATDTEDYFLAHSRGGRRMPVWAVAISLLATIQSAATFMGAPEQGATGGLKYLVANLGAVAAAGVLFYAFLPAYYRLGVRTPYGLLAARLGPAAALGASWTYLIGRTFGSGARLFLGALPFSILVFGDAGLGHIAACVAAFIVFGVAFTFVGGLRGAIWTDVLQVAVYIGAAIALLVGLFIRIDAPLGTVVHALAYPPEGGSRLNPIPVGLDFSRPNLGFNPADSFTLLTALTGCLLLNLGFYATDQDLTQRTLACRNAREGAWSVLSGTLIGIPASLLFLLIGLLLYVFYDRPDITGRSPPLHAVPGIAGRLVGFTLNELPAGMAGLLLAGVLAAGPAGINGSLNSMASAFTNDFYRRVRPGRSDPHYLAVGRAAVVGWGVVMGAAALVCARWYASGGDGKANRTLIDLALGIMTFAYAGLLGVFFTAVLTRRGNGASAIAALVAGPATVVLLQRDVWGRTLGLVPLGGNWPASIDLAWPWQLVIGTAVAFAVCGVGRRGPAPAPPESHEPRGGASDPIDRSRA